MLVLLGAVGAAATCDPWDPVYDCTPEGRGELFEKRIAPLLDEERPKSCNQCHLSGVDLELWFKGDACQTMACMVHEGLVDLGAPEQSMVLSWIDRAAPDSAGIDASVLKEERDGFLEWIRMTAACGACASADDFDGDPCERGAYEPVGNDCAADEPGLIANGYDDPGDCSDATLEQLFQDTFFPVRRRCYPCHYENFPNDLPEAPKWIAVGPCDVAALQTMRNVTNSGYIDIDDPLHSLWILKPLDGAIGGIGHGGGPKFFTLDELGVPEMMHFAERWAACQRD